MSSTSNPRLVITDSLGTRAVSCDRPLVTIGRRPEADVRLSDNGVSRAHAEIVSENGQQRIRDCESRFGTFVNGERVTERPLASGDRLSFGQAEGTTIVFLCDAEQAAGASSAELLVGEIRQVAGLLEGLRALGSGRVLEDVLTLVLDAAVEVTGAERAFIMLADEKGQLEFKQARARGKLTLPGRTFATSRKIPEEVFATGKDAIVEDLLDAGLAGEHMGTVALGIRHVLCTPLRLVRYVERAEDRGDDRAIGVLYVDSRERGALRSNRAEAALHTLSNEAAVAIENARLYRQALERAKLERELQVAADIQQALLPPSDRRGAFFTISGVSVPCRAVGGDFFDYVDLPGGQLGFILGDVTGKGPPAALLSAALLGMFGSEATYQSAAAPVLTRMNLGMFRRSVGGRFATTFYGVLGPDGRFTYCNGGHNPPFLVSALGVRRLETGGLVLGLFESAAYEEETLTLAGGDFLVVFSDGVSEAVNEADEDFTDDRLQASIAAHRTKPPREMLEAMLADVKAFCGKALPVDDVTMVVLRYDGSA